MKRHVAYKNCLIMCRKYDLGLATTNYCLAFQLNVANIAPSTYSV